MELRVYSPRPSRRRGECHAVETTARLERLIRRAGGRVRLAAHNPAGRQGKGRLRRAVAVRRGGRWLDLGETLIREGHALWLPGTDELAWNARYNRAQQEAAQAGRNMWNPVHCGVGPAQDVPLRVWASSDPLGNDEANINGEWIKVRNLSPATPVDLGRWWVRDSMLRRYTFRPGTLLAPGATVTVHVGRGTDGPSTFFWGLDHPIFENAIDDGRDLGDGAFLFDPEGDLRAWMLYPCLVACADPLQGAVELSAHPRQPESVSVRNVSDRPVDLYGYQLRLPGSSYAFEEGPALPPGETLVVEVAGDPADDTALRRHWGVDRYMLVDAGGAIRLSTFTGIDVACAAWGDGACR